MNNQRKLYKNYEKILAKELVPAMGMYRADCLGLLCGCSAQRTWKCFRKRLLLKPAEILIKNVKSVIVPNTDGARGIEALRLSVLWRDVKIWRWKCFQK